MSLLVKVSALVQSEATIDAEPSRMITTSSLALHGGGGAGGVGGVGGAGGSPLHAHSVAAGSGPSQVTLPFQSKVQLGPPAGHVQWHVIE